jgi:hypothetical protein
MTDHTLYRFFDREGSLLYVGRTIAPARRWREHEKRAPWYAAVASVTREVHPTAEAVDLAERAAIANERPIHNIMLNPRSKPQRPARRKVGGTDTFLARLAVLPEDEDIPAVGECLGDETVCECSECHERRELRFEDLRSKYEWHPNVDATIRAVEASYYQGAPLADWYYDLFDIELFARMRLVTESAANPLPAYLSEIDGAVAKVDCPFCFAQHHHFLTTGTLLDHPFDAGCERVPGGRYRLFADYLTALDKQYLWGEQSAKRAA